MAEVDARIPLMAQSPQPITVNTLIQMRQMAQQRRAQNALMTIFRTPGMTDPNGMPTPQAINAVSQISPQMGMQMAGQLAAVRQKQAATSKDALAAQGTRLKLAAGPADTGTSAYLAAIGDGATPQQAQQAGQEAYAASRQELADSGVLGDAVDQLVPKAFNYQTASGQAIKAKDQAGLNERKMADQRANESLAQRTQYEGAELGIANQRLGLEASRLHDAQQGVATDLSPQALDLAANVYLQTGNMPPTGYGKAGAAMKQQILNRAAELSGGNGNSASETAANMSVGRGLRSGIAKLEGQAQVVESFEKTAFKNADLALGASEKTDRSGIPYFNKWLLAGKTGTGNVEAANFNAANNSFVEEYAKVMSGASGGGVAATDSARQRAHELLNTSQTPDQYRTNVAILKKEMNNRVDAFNEQLQQGKAQLTGLSKSSKPTADEIIQQANAAVKAHPDKQAQIEARMRQLMQQYGYQPEAAHGGQ